jgi:hypothetical protein
MKKKLFTYKTVFLGSSKEDLKNLPNVMSLYKKPSDRRETFSLKE